MIAVLESDVRSLEEFAQEIVFLRELRHGNLVLFYGAGQRQVDNAPFCVMEFMERGSLRSVLDCETETLDWALRVRFAVDIARGMRHLHSRAPPVLHRDLKAENCLVDEKWTVKVSDFGSSALATRKHTVATMKTVLPSSGGVGDGDGGGVRIQATAYKEGATEAAAAVLVSGASRETVRELDMVASSESHTQPGSLLWQAPELLSGGRFASPCDVYSFAIVLWEILR